MTMRSKLEIFLFGKPQLRINHFLIIIFLSEIKSSELKPFQYYHMWYNKGLQFLCYNTCDCICRNMSSNYDKIGIPIIQPHKVKAKVNQLLQDHTSLQKQMSRVTAKE